MPKSPSTMNTFTAMTVTLMMGLLCLKSVAKNPLEDVPLRYVRGVYEIPENPNSLPVIYDNYFSIYYEFTLPQWDASSMKIQFWKNHNNCTESDSYVDGYPCPVMHHMNTIIDYFVGNMTMWKNLFLDDPHPSTHSSSEEEEEDSLLLKNPDIDVPLLYTRNHSVLLDTEYYCSRIVPHFSKFQTTSHRLNEYKKLMEVCESDIIRIPVNMSATAINIESLYHSTFTSFVTDYWEKLPEFTKQESVVNLWTSLQSTLMLHQFMETSKWSNAISSCQQGQIPWTLIDHDMLSEAILHESKDEAEVKRHLAIPLSELPKYYKLPLTDCVFVDNDKFLVRVLVPWRNTIPTSDPQDGINPYKIIRYEPLVFHEDGHFCWIDEIRDKRFLVNSLGTLFHTECNTDQEQSLCRTYTNNFSSHDSPDPCIQALFDDVEEDIVDNCFLKCHPISKRHYSYRFFNLAQTTDDNFIYAVSDDDQMMEITCKGMETLKLGKMEFAAWNISLPCGCEIKIMNGTLVNYQIVAPCYNHVIVEKIRPYHWRNVTLEQFKTRDHNEFQEFQKERAKPFRKSKDDDDYDEEEFWKHLDERYGSSFLGQIVLWLVILVLSLVVCGLTLVVLQLRKWHQQEVFKETRLIYNVGDNQEHFQLGNSQQQGH